MTAENDEIARLMRMVESRPGFKIYQAILKSGFDWATSAEGTVTASRSVSVDGPGFPINVTVTIKHRDGRFAAVMRAARLPLAQDKTRDYASLEEAKEKATKELATMASCIADLGVQIQP